MQLPNIEFIALRISKENMNSKVVFFEHFTSASKPVGVPGSNKTSGNAVLRDYYYISSVRKKKGQSPSIG